MASLDAAIYLKIICVRHIIKHILPKHLEKIKDLYPYDFIKFMASKKFARYKNFCLPKAI